MGDFTEEDKTYGVPRRRLTGLSHFVQDVVLSSNGQFALSGSWDGELRLWDLAACTSACRFVGHTKDVLSVAFSIDNRQIMAEGKRLYSLDAGSIIHALCSSPNRYWLCAATESSIKIWDLERKSIVEDLKIDFRNEAGVTTGGGTATKKKLGWS